MVWVLTICQTTATTIAEEGTALNTTSIQRNIWILFFWRKFNLKSLWKNIEIPFDFANTWLKDKFVLWFTKIKLKTRWVEIILYLSEETIETRDAFLNTPFSSLPTQEHHIDWTPDFTSDINRIINVLKQNFSTQ